MDYCQLEKLALLASLEPFFCPFLSYHYIIKSTVLFGVLSNTGSLYFSLKTFLLCFHQLGPLGRVVAMSVCLCVCLSPSHAIFLRGLTGADCASSVDWCDLDLDLDLEDVFRSLISISILSIALKIRMCSGV